MNQPKVSVIIPVYNVENYLRECLDSVVNQTLEDIEIICVDDGSTDGSPEILRAYENTDERIVVISKSNEGAGPTRTLGIRRAHGEYIAFMDGDDYYPEETTLEKLYFTSKKQNVLICGGSLCIVKDGARKTDFSSGRNWGYTLPFDALLSYRDYQFDYGFYRFLYQRQFLIDNNIFFPSYRRFQDPPFFVKAMSTAGEFYAIHDLTYCYRESVNFKGVIKDERKYCDMLRGYADVLDMAKANQLRKLYSLEMERIFDTGWSFVEAAMQLHKPIAADALDRLAEAFDPSFWRPDLNVEGNGVQKLAAARTLILAEKNGKGGQKTHVSTDKESVQYGSRYLNAEKDPIISVIVPVFNTEPFLADCLDSIIGQTLEDIAIICVNDGSTDGSPAILEEYQKKDPRIIIVNRPNGGLSAARNSGMRYARGKYIYFMDSDDILERDALKTVFVTAEENNLDAALFDVEPFYESESLAKNNRIHYKHISAATGIMSGVEYMRVSKDQGTYAMMAWIALWRRAFLEEQGITFKEGIIHEDNLFSFQAYIAADRVMRLPDRFYRRRIRENSIMTSPKSAKSVSGYFSCSIGVMKYALNNADPEKEQEIKREYSRMLGAARLAYNAISDEEKEKIFFVSEIETELFNQLIKDPARPVASDEQQKRADRLQKDPARPVASDEQQKRADRLQYDLDCVHNSVSFRLGRGITWLPRKLRGGVRCYRDHGAGYTFRRALYHMGLWKDEEEE